MTVRNRCFAGHVFRLEKDRLDFLTFLEPADNIAVAPGAGRQIAVRFDSAGLTPAVYRGQLTVRCLDCLEEPGCTQDRELLGVEMTVLAPPQQIVGYKYWDRNGNGIWEGDPTTPTIPGDEPPLQGWEVSLTGLEGTRTATTDASGRFQFEVGPGLYTIREAERSGWRATTPSSVTVEVPEFERPTLAAILFGNETTERVNECLLTTKIEPGSGISVEALKPQTGSSSSATNEVVPLIVQASDLDQLFQSCHCLADGQSRCSATKAIEIVDSVSYQWTKLEGEGTLLSGSGPATLFQPPDLEVGETAEARLLAEVTESRGNDKPARIVFDLSVAREEECKYTRTVSLQKEADTSAPSVITPRACDCRPQEEKWAAIPAQLVGEAPQELEVCAGQVVILGAGGSDSDTLQLLCDGGECGTDSRRPSLIDEVTYRWESAAGGFSEYPGGVALTNSRQTTVIYRAPSGVQQDSITLEIQDSGKQAADPAVPKKIPVKIARLDLELQGLAEADEVCPGGFLCLNVDDDDKDGKIDLADDNVAADDELMQLRIDKDPAKTMVLDAPKGKERIRIWQQRQKLIEVPLPKTFGPGVFNQTLWIEGIKASDELGDVELVLSCADPKCEDRLKLTVLKVDLDVDADRDGTVEADRDDTREEEWERGADKRGAVVLPNSDEDQAGAARDDKPDNWPGGDLDGDGFDDDPDSVVNGNADVADIGELWAHKLGPRTLPDDLRIVLRVEKVTGENAYFAPTVPNRRVRIFLPTRKVGNDLAIQDGDKELIGPGNPSDASVGAGTSRVTFLKNPAPGKPEERSYDIFKGTGIVKFGIEGIEFGAPVTAILEVFLGGNLICKDEVQLRVSPFIAFSHKQNIDAAAPAVFVEDRGGGNAELRTKLGASYGARLDVTTTGDPWQQDGYEIGYAQAPYGRMHVILGLPRGRRWGGLLNTWVRDTLMRDGIGLIARFYNNPAWGDQDDGGNMEVQPRDKFGIIVFGKGPSDEINSDIVEFLRAQEVQRVVDDIDLTWMALGHIDEVVSFASSASQRARVASPEAAWALLLIAKKFHGGGAENLLGGMNGGPRSVDDILTNVALRNHNFARPDGYSEKIQGVRGQLGLQPSVTGQVSNTNAVRLHRVGYLEGYDGAGAEVRWRLRFTGPDDFTLQRRAGGGGWAADGAGKKSEDFVSDSKVVYILQDWWSGTARKGHQFLFRTRPSSDNIELPVLFRDAGGALAHTNNIVNSVVDGTTVFVAQTHGPEVLGGAPKRDILEFYAEEACQRVGFTTVTFTEERIYHNGSGSIHCGTNVRRAIPSAAEDLWWNQR